MKKLLNLVDLAHSRKLINSLFKLGGSEAFVQLMVVNTFMEELEKLSKDIKMEKISSSTYNDTFYYKLKDVEFKSISDFCERLKFEKIKDETFREILYFLKVAMEQERNLKPLILIQQLCDQLIEEYYELVKEEENISLPNKN